MRAGSNRTSSTLTLRRAGAGSPLGLDLGEKGQDRIPGVQPAAVHRDRDVVRRRRTSSLHCVSQRVEVPLLDRRNPLRAHVVHDTQPGLRSGPTRPPRMYQRCINPACTGACSTSTTVRQFSIMPAQRHHPAQTNTSRTGSDQIWEQEVAGSNPASPTVWTLVRRRAVTANELWGNCESTFPSARPPRMARCGALDAPESPWSTAVWSGDVGVPGPPTLPPGRPRRGRHLPGRRADRSRHGARARRRVGRLLRGTGRAGSATCRQRSSTRSFYNFADGEVARHLPRLGHSDPGGRQRGARTGFGRRVAKDPRPPRRRPGRRPCGRPRRQGRDQRTDRG